MRFLLYGDGVHDDTDALQELIDAGKHELILPEPEVCYLISRPLELPSDFKLSLPRYAEIKLMAGSNCMMLRSKTAPEGGKPLLGEAEHPLFACIGEHSPAHPFRNITIEGGIWNANNLEQRPNPLRTRDFSNRYSGFVMCFVYGKGLRLANLTVKDPVTFSVVLDSVSYFTVENITFDFNYGNPDATNMDGIHLDGNCHFGRICNLQGACYDDLVALNADEGTGGPISHIDVDGIYCEDCHSAVRILTVNYPVEYITIRNIHGTFYQYCVGLTKYYPGKTNGFFDAIRLSEVYASKAERIPVYGKDPGGYVFPLIYMEEETKIGTLKVEDLHRKEELVPISTFYLGEKAEIEHLVLREIYTENRTGKPMMFFDCRGDVAHLTAENLFADGNKVILE